MHDVEMLACGLFAAMAVLSLGCRDAPSTRTVAPPVAPARSSYVGPPPLSPFRQLELVPSASVCSGVTCSNHGRCVAVTEFPFLLGETVPACECEAGFLAVGDACIACREVTGSTFDIDVPVVRIAGKVTLGGRPLPKDLPGRIVLVEAERRDPRNAIRLGSSFAFDLIPGRYDVRYSERSHGNNVALTIARGFEVRANGTRLAIDVALERVPIEITVAGKPPLAPSIGVLVFKRGDDIRELPIASNLAPIYMPPGAYRVSYQARRISVDGAAPSPDPPGTAAVDAPLGDVVVGPGARLRIDVPLVRVDGTVTGFTPPFDAVATTVGFVPVGGESSGTVELWANGSFSAELVAGRYDVWLRTTSGQRSLSALVARDVAIPGPPLALSPPRTVALHGRYLVDSSPIPVERDADVGLVAIGEGDVAGAFQIPLDPIGGFAVRLPRGRYTLAHVRGLANGMPRVLALDRFDLVADRAWSMDLSLVEVGARVTIDGIAPPPPGSMGALALTSVASPFGATIWPRPAKLPPGRYRTAFQLGSPPPAGFGATSNPPVATPFDITQRTTLEIAAVTRRLSGALTMGGKRRKGTTAGLSLEGTDNTHLADLADGRYTTRLAPGSYAVRYFNAFVVDEPTMPRNSNADLGCITIE